MLIGSIGDITVDEPSRKCSKSARSGLFGNLSFESFSRSKAQSVEYHTVEMTVP